VQGPGDIGPRFKPLSRKVLVDLINKHVALSGLKSALYVGLRLHRGGAMFVLLGALRRR
jgi:hypothetical protein